MTHRSLRVHQLTTPLTATPYPPTSDCVPSCFRAQLSKSSISLSGVCSLADRLFGWCCCLRSHCQGRQTSVWATQHSMSLRYTPAPLKSNVNKRQLITCTHVPVRSPVPDGSKCFINFYVQLNSRANLKGNKEQTSLKHINNLIWNTISRSYAEAPAINRAFPQLMGTPWCSVTFLVWTIYRGGPGGQWMKVLTLQQQEYFVDLGYFHSHMQDTDWFWFTVDRSDPSDMYLIGLGRKHGKNRHPLSACLRSQQHNPVKLLPSYLCNYQGLINQNS